MKHFEYLSEVYSDPISCVEMHTTGEPTRIVISGHPELSGTLLEQRSQAKAEHDNIRRQLMLEPRGHFDMYGAILRPITELTVAGQAHIGVLFITNDGYSTMCGHATIALGRFLLDTQDLNIFPRRKEIHHDPITNTATLNLHAPCGLLKVTVPVTADGTHSDPSRPVSFISVPSFATAVNIVIPIDPTHSWPELSTRSSITASFAYGGAFFCLVSAIELGFPQGLSKPNYDAMKKATSLLKAAVTSNPDFQHLFQHPIYPDLSHLYSVIIVDDTIGVPSAGSSGVETGLCYFAEQQVDRSPTGSGVAARVALAYALDKRKVGETWTYHSVVSNQWDDTRGGFVGSVLEEEKEQQDLYSKLKYPVVRVRIEGYAFYTGTSTFVVEKEDPLGRDGFVLEKLQDV